MDAQKARELTDQTIAEDMQKLPKYLKKALSIVKSAIKKEIEEGKYSLFISKRDFCNHVKIAAVSDEVFKQVVIHLTYEKYNVSIVQNDDGPFYLDISWK